jgi:hypothetical protein
MKTSLALLFAPKPAVVNALLTAAAWEGTAAPFTQTLPVSGVTEDSGGEACIADSVTPEQWAAATAAQLHKTAQGNGFVVISAFGEKPAADIPITVVIQ